MLSHPKDLQTNSAQQLLYTNSDKLTCAKPARLNNCRHYTALQHHHWNHRLSFFGGPPHTNRFCSSAKAGLGPKSRLGPGRAILTHWEVLQPPKTVLFKQLSFFLYQEKFSSSLPISPDITNSQGNSCRGFWMFWTLCLPDGDQYTIHAVWGAHSLCEPRCIILHHQTVFAVNITKYNTPQW